MHLKRLYLFLISLLCVLSLAACHNDSSISKEDHQKENESSVPNEIQETENEFELAIKEKNEELEQGQIILTSYAVEVDATLTEPTETNFAVNESVTIEGSVNQHENLKGNYIWVQVYFDGDTLTDQTQHYYIPLKDGVFKQNITLSHGNGKYSLTVLLPGKDQTNYYYDLAQFDVFNINPNLKHEISYSAFAQDVDLVIQSPHSGYAKENEVFTLTGKVNLQEDHDSVMLELTKDGEMWKHILPVKDGLFTYDVPLFYGKGVHELKVYVPDNERDNYFQEGTSIYIDNESDLIKEPIKYMTTYEERGVTVDFPNYGGDETELTYSIKGTIDKDAPFAKETTHLYITTEKDGEEALAVIPVTDYAFDDEFYLRFGPGTYEVTVSVPEIKEINSDTFYYQHVAQFSVTNITEEDQRDTLPSRGVQSDTAKINTLANELTNDTMSDREKAKAIYEYTAKTISYDVDKLNNNDFNWDDSALKTLESGTGVCQDYTYLSLALLRASGMEARYVAGTAGSGFDSARHAWVEVNVDNEWITMDPTWGSGYIDENEFVAKYTEDYFEPNEEAFKTHTRTGVEY